MEYKKKSLQPCKLSIIIPVYNGEKTLATCLDSIFSDNESFFEVVLVDDGSTDGTVSIAEQYPCRIIRMEQNMGRSVARNRAIAESRSDTLLFTDADCIVCKNWAAAALKTFQNLRKNDPLITAVEGQVLPLKGFINKCDAYAGYGYNQDLVPRYHEHFCTANLIADKNILEEAGLFNPAILNSNEDQDLGLRLLEKGYRLYYDPSLSVIHNHTRIGFLNFLKHYFDWGKSIGNYMDIRYASLRRIPFPKIINQPVVYFLASPVFALLITLKITLFNLKHDFTVIFLFPFIFLSKIAYRIGTLHFMRSDRLRKIFAELKKLSNNTL